MKQGEPPTRDSRLERPTGASAALRLVTHVYRVQHAALPGRDRQAQADDHRGGGPEHRAWEIAAENRGAASLSAFDARWVTAARVVEALEGGRAAVLRPEARARLVAGATGMGLRPFDANLVIAIVQDAARCGRPALDAETEGRLTLVPAPGNAERSRDARWLLAVALLGLLWAGVLVGWILL